MWLKRRWNAHLLVSFQFNQTPVHLFDRIHSFPDTYEWSSTKKWEIVQKHNEHLAGELLRPHKIEKNLYAKHKVILGAQKGENKSGFAVQLGCRNRQWTQTLERWAVSPGSPYSGEWKKGHQQTLFQRGVSSSPQLPEDKEETGGSSSLPASSVMCLKLAISKDSHKEQLSAAFFC